MCTQSQPPQLSSPYHEGQSGIKFMCWTISWLNKLHWLWHHGIALSGNALPSNYHQLPVLKQDLGSHKFPGDKTGTTVVTQWLITRQRVTATRNKKAPFLDTFRFSAMHRRELGVESNAMCRMWQFLAVLRSVFHSSLLYTLSFHPFPPTTLPFSLTSSCHLFLGLPLSLVVSTFIHNTILGILLSNIYIYLYSRTYQPWPNMLVVTI